MSGAGDAAGNDYQNRVAAWIAVQILAEQHAAPPTWLAPGGTIDFLRCQEQVPVDDVVVGTSTGGRTFVQAKHTVGLSDKENSPLGKALVQMVRQFLRCASSPPDSHSLDRPLDPDRDRLVLACDRGSSESIRKNLHLILDRIRRLPPSLPIEDAACNETDGEVLGSILTLVDRTWKSIKGPEPTDDDKRTLLRFVHLGVVEVEDDGPAAVGAREALRSVVLADPARADAAWSVLITEFGGQAWKESGATRQSLWGLLQNHGFESKAPPSYQGDIATLHRVSRRFRDVISDLSRIDAGHIRVQIRRPVTQELRRAAELSSLVVVGEPGAGKSGAMHELVVGLEAEGRDVVLLVVDRLQSQSLGGLQAELGLRRDLVDVLGNWPGSKPGFLLLEGFDAARDHHAAEILIDLLQHLATQGARWRAIVSIRKYDLGHSGRLRGMFSGSPPSAMQDPGFPEVVHLNVPALGDEELDEVGRQAPGLRRLCDDAPPDLRALLRVPFNLRLAAELLASGVKAEELVPLRTQADLLERYWAARVLGEDAAGDMRVRILRRMCEQMLRARSLRAMRHEVVEPGTEDALRSLLSRAVVSEWKADPTASPDLDTVVFAHHVLFDYAVARLLLRAPEAALKERLVSDRELAMAIRPSLCLHYRFLWGRDAGRCTFWSAVLGLAADTRLSQMAKSIGPSVAAQLARDLRELQPLVLALRSEREEERAAAECSLRHLFGALQAGTGGSAQLTGEGAGPWCDLLAAVVEQPRLSVVGAVAPAIAQATDKKANLGQGQVAALGLVARGLLTLARQHSPRIRGLIRLGLSAVLRTFESDPVASRVILMPSLERPHLEQFGFEELHEFASRLPRLFAIAPDFAREVYEKTFAYKERRRDETRLGDSKLLGLVSNQAQDYSNALYGLGEEFGEFAKAAPLAAVRAMVAVMSSYVPYESSDDSDELKEEPFDFDGIPACLRPDYSYIWDEGEIRNHDPAVRVMTAFFGYMRGLAESGASTETLRELVVALATENRRGAVWRRLLKLGTEFPASLGVLLRPLGWAHAALCGLAEKGTIGRFLSSIYPYLGLQDRERIERAILAIPSRFPGDSREMSERLRDRLLERLPKDLLATEAATLRISEIACQSEAERRRRVDPGPQASHGDPPTETPTPRSDSAPAMTVRLRQMVQALREFENAHMNSAPAAEAVTIVLPLCAEMESALSGPDLSPVDPSLICEARSVLAGACASIAGCGSVDPETALPLIRRQLLAAARDPVPEHDAQHDEGFDRCPSWSPAPRIHAAQALSNLARHGGGPVEEVLEALERLVADPVAAVRFHAVRSLVALVDFSPEWVWAATLRLCHPEQSRAVLQALLNGVLRDFAPSRPDPVVHLLRGILDCVVDGDGADTVRRSALQILRWLYVSRDNQASREILFGIAKATTKVSREDCGELADVRGLAHTPDATAASREETETRGRRWVLIEGVTRSLVAQFESILAPHEADPGLPWGDEEREGLQGLAHVLEGIVRNIEVESESGRGTRGRSKDQEMTESQRLRCFRECLPVIRLLSKVGFAPVAHGVMGTLEGWIEFDPRGVFLLISETVRTAKKWGYDYEEAAADLVVSLINRYLAEYLGMLRQDDECRAALVDVLDVFVDRGWPAARRLSYRLEDIYR